MTDGGNRNRLRLAEDGDVAAHVPQALATEQRRDGRLMRARQDVQAAAGWVACHVFGLHAYVTTSRSVAERGDSDVVVPEMVHGECVRCGDTFDFEN